ncbi:DMT family transporter [Euzebya sp.]|uniref:DMT family transporter n=1 Tax=Euzebya sp. TaxID=1971409 RepID=UPI00351843B3
MSPTPAIRPVLAVVTAAVLWGTSGVVGRSLNESGVPPLTVAALRVVIAATVLVAVPRLRPAAAHRLPRRSPVVIGVGVLLAIYQATFFAAVPLVGVTVATMVSLGAAPIVTAAVGPLVGDTRAGVATWTAVLLGALGVGLLSGGGGTSLGWAAVGGAGLALVAGSGYAGVTLLGRHARDAVPGALVTAAFPVAAVVLLPALVGLAGAELDGGDVAAIAYLGTAPTALAYALFFGGVARIPAATASTITLLEPLTATVLAAAIFGEALSPVGVAGAILVVLAGGLAVRAALPRRTTARTPAGVPDR